MISSARGHIYIHINDSAAPSVHASSGEPLEEDCCRGLGRTQGRTLRDAPKSPCDPAGVKLVQRNPADIEPDSLVVVHIQNNTYFGVGGTNHPKGCLWSGNSTSKKLLVRRRTSEGGKRRGRPPVEENPLHRESTLRGT